MRILCDTNILARAATRPGGPAQEAVRRIVESDEHVLIVTPFLLEELTRVLGYTRVTLRSTATIEEVAGFVTALERAADLVEPAVGSAIMSDPNDDPILAGAILGKADVLCTRDGHFRQAAVQALCSTYKIRLLDEVDLLVELRQSAS